MKTILFIASFTIIFLSVKAQNPNPEMAFIEGGTFKMGNQESKYIDEFPAHNVTVSNFYISRYEVTVAEYSRFSRMAGLPQVPGAENVPATQVSWFDAVMYCNWLSQINGLERSYIIVRSDNNTIVKFIPNSKGYRLPTEAEWEFAARGGNKSQKFTYSGSNKAMEVAWFVESGKMLHKPGLKAPNELGLYDMSGNCLEWCFDNYDATFYSEEDKTNPIGPEISLTKVCKGGNYKGVEENLRITKRYFQSPDYKDESLGFRVVRNE